VLAYCTVLHALTHAEARLSDPLHPLLFVLFGGAVVVGSSRGWRTAGPGSAREGPSVLEEDAIAFQRDGRS
jgi:hypothetical protein